MIIYVNAAGCPNTCRHCASSGRRPYGGFYALDELREMAREWGPIVPYFEFTAHPEFPEILNPEIVGEGWRSFPTNGFGLAEREDYREVFSRLREFGINEVSFTLHGLKEKHDWFVCREGAFETIMAAGRRAMEMGVEILMQVYLDRRNLEDVPALIELGKQEFGLQTIWLEIPYHRVSRRFWRYETLRPGLNSVTELLQGLDSQSWRGPFQSSSLQELTERSWLHAWEKEPQSDRFGPPQPWLPSTFLEEGWLMIDRSRTVSFDPWCGEPIALGKLSDGKEEIMRRFEQVVAPPYFGISPQEAKSLIGDSDLLHPNGFSVRCKAISNALFARETPGRAESYAPN